MLLEAVWGYAFAPDRQYRRKQSQRLRTALIGIDCDPIETQRGAGYILRSERCA